MPSNKSQTSLPKGWPGNTLYLKAPVYSRKLCGDKLNSLKCSRSDLPSVTSIYKACGPYNNVKITHVTKADHPANGQFALHADQHLPADSFILQYLGYVHDQSDTDTASDYDLSLDRELGIGVDASGMGTEARYINDYRGVSSAPNAEFRDIYVEIAAGKVERRVGVFVLSAGKSGKRAKGIARGQEILVSYGKGFWTERKSSAD